MATVRPVPLEQSVMQPNYAAQVKLALHKNAQPNIKPIQLH